MNINNLKTTYNINSSCPPCRTVVSHDCDVNTRAVEVCFYQGMIPLVISKDCTAKAIFVERETNILINDNVPCTVTEAGSVLIPVDNLHRQGRFDMNIELTVINQGGEQVLVTPFPMWITVNGSILNEAEVTEESKGTVPELLEAAEEALSEAKDYEKLDNLPAINGHELVGNKTGDDLGLQNKLTAGENITINANGEISATGGVKSYSQLSDLPSLIYDYGTPPFQQHQMYTFYGISIDERDGLVVTSMPSGPRPIISLAKNVFRSDYTKVVNNYNFNVVSRYGVNASFRAQLSTATNVPTEFSILTDVVYITHYWNPATGGTGQLVRHVTGQDANGKIHYFVNIAEGTYNINGLTVTSSSWAEITRYISSATVNQNGTITFTMSDGSTVTTTGESVIGPQGDDYVLTAQDKSDIAAIVLSELPTTQGVLYGNASN